MAEKIKSITDDFLGQKLHIEKCYIVFMDIVKYSKRLPIYQFTVLGKFNRHIISTIELLANKFYIPFDNTITLPTGDGMAIVFPFNSIPNLHLKFAENFLILLQKENEQVTCDLFLKEGYCLEHDHYKVRIGIGVGDCILYEDINGQSNLAGNEINLASRAMGLAGFNQIVFTEKAFEDYKNFNQEFKHNHFVHYSNVKIKHDDCIDIYHFVKVPSDPTPLKPEYCENGKIPTPIEILKSAPTEITSESDMINKILSGEVRDLLKAASDDPNGQILFLSFMGGNFVVQSNDIKFNSTSEPIEKTKWIYLINQLIKLEIIMRKIPGREGTFLITQKGRDIALMKH